MELGNFSVSLAVADIQTSLAFYRKLGFTEVGGNIAENWVVLKNGAARIGLFQGMFEGNLLTFNPGWDADASPLAEFTDVREIQRQLVASGINPEPRADESTTGPAYLSLVDPDGNTILIDQHL
ncbi:MAG: VOC family protein [Candidatus Nanopelagicales bacterium]